MSVQPSLFDSPDQAAPAASPPLTARQHSALEVLVAHGQGGATSDEVGAAWCATRGKHDPDGRCQWCGVGGRDVLRALRRKGLAKQRRDGTGSWVAANLPAPAADSAFGEFPEGF